MIFPPHLLQLTKLFHIGFNFITADNIPEPNWRTNRKYPLNKGEFLKLYTDYLCLLGVSFGDKTRYAMLDIDIDSPYHPRNDPQAYARLLSTLEQIELVCPVPIRSSHSGGIHLYYFFPRPVSTFRIAALIRVTLINAKFPIKNGQIEIFPNTKAYSSDKSKPSYYKAHRLPLQPDSGACLLDQWGDELICAANLTDEGQLGMFLAEADRSASANDIQWIESKFEWAYNLFKKQIAKYQHHSSKYSEVAQEWKENLELSFDIGWTDYHQTNELLPLFICYGIVFEGLEDKQELFNWVHQKIIATRGYQEYCRHQHEIERKIWDWVNGTIDNQYYVKYCGFPPRCGITPHQLVARLNPHKSQINLHNQTVAQAALERIKAAVAAILELPAQVSGRINAIKTKAKELFGISVSTHTLNKHRAVWHPTRYQPDPISELQAVVNETLLVCDKSEIDSDYLVGADPKTTASTSFAIAPPLDRPEPISYKQIESIECERLEENQIAQIQAQPESDRTPPIYEAFITELTPPLDLGFVPVPEEVAISPDLQTSSHSYHENLSTSSSDFLNSESPLESILQRRISANEPKLEPESESELEFVSTYRGSHIEPLETVSATKAHRSVVEIAQDLRANILAIDDELLREFLDHPQCEAIELTIELANKLVAARTRELIQSVVADLTRCQKIDLWRVLEVEERAAVEALMAPPAPVSPDRAIEKKEPMLSKGAVVRTLTGLIGVVQHVFQSVTKPFVVHHAEIGRTILYGIEDLRLAN